MVEKCPYCEKGFENKMALGSHIHYVHESQTWTETSRKRSPTERERFEKIFDSCLTDMGLTKLKQVEKLERAVRDIPEGVSDIVDQYRDALRCAHSKEELVKEIEEDAKREVGDTNGKSPKRSNRIQ